MSVELYYGQKDNVTATKASAVKKLLARFGELEGQMSTLSSCVLHQPAAIFDMWVESQAAPGEDSVDIDGLLHKLMATGYKDHFVNCFMALPSGEETPCAELTGRACMVAAKTHDCIADPTQPDAVNLVLDDQVEFKFSLSGVEACVSCCIVYIDVKSSVYQTEANVVIHNLEASFNTDGHTSRQVNVELLENSDKLLVSHRIVIPLGHSSASSQLNVKLSNSTTPRDYWSSRPSLNIAVTGVEFHGALCWSSPLSYTSFTRDSAVYAEYLRSSIAPGCAVEASEGFGAVAKYERGYFVGY